MYFNFPWIAEDFDGSMLLYVESFLASNSHPSNLLPSLPYWMFRSDKDHPNEMYALLTSESLMPWTVDTSSSSVVFGTSVVGSSGIPYSRWGLVGAPYCCWSVLGAPYCCWGASGAPYCCWGAFGVPYCCWGTFGASYCCWGAFGAAYCCWGAFGIPYCCLGCLWGRLKAGPAGLQPDAA